MAAEALPPVAGDRAQLVTLFGQLLDNAARFRGDDPPLITVSAGAPDADGMVRVSVADNGAGLAEADLPRLFTVFARPAAPPPRSDTAGRNTGERGAGLGLALCRRIVERHGGTIWAERPAEGGLVVTFELPAEPGPGAPGRRAHRSAKDG